MNNGPTLQSGAHGDHVRRLQRLLVMLKILGGAAQIDGTFGPKTKTAVEAFQSGSGGLAVDGIVGPATWAALPADPNTPQLARGAHGSAVTGLQHGLATFNPGPADGDFGPQTEHAVKAYQADRGLPADGIVGDRTWWEPAGAAGATLASLSGLTTV
jgi:peptidoglycan hydrolase-like protein with peptidoglycan-binding domain